MKQAIFAAAVLSLSATTVLAQDTTVLTGKDAFGDFSQDAPGVKRLIKSTDLEPPGVTASASNAPGGVPMPDGAMPKVPDGFTVEMVASGITNPRVLSFAPNGDLFVAN